MEDLARASTAPIRRISGKTVTIALLVGTVLFAINQLDVVLGGRATGVVWFKVLLTYLVPFCVSNYGILVATHREDSES